MAGYLLIESRDTIDSSQAHALYGLARGLRDRGHSVTVFLVQNGVLAARESPASGLVTNAMRAGVSVFVDDHSLQERGIDRERLLAGVQPGPIELAIERLGHNHIALWH